jgi:hypothetical protein
MGDVLSGKIVPLSVSLKDCGGGWGAFINNGPANPPELARLMDLVRGAAPGGLLDTMYLSKGELVQVNGVTYLVAYQLSTPLPEVVARAIQIAEMQPIERTQPQDLVPIIKSYRWTGDTTLPLCLMEITGMGDLHDIQPFDVPKTLKANNPLVRFAADMLKLAGVELTPEGDLVVPPPSTIPAPLW